MPARYRRVQVNDSSGLSAGKPAGILAGTDEGKAGVGAMVDEPLSTLQLEQMRGYAEAMQTARHAIESVSSELVVASDYMLKLLAEVERLQADLAEAHIIAAAEIHEEGHRLIARDRNATLHQLLTFIERKYGRDLLVVHWSK